MGTRILWQRLDLPGHEISALAPRTGGWLLDGTVLVVHEGRPCQLSYRIECDAEWETKSVEIRGQVGDRQVRLDLARSPASAWQLNGVPVPQVDGCIDVDLGFSPSTNLLPIRRLNLAIGGRATVRAAWVRFPELSLELLEQVYTRIDAHRYQYESADGAFRRELSTGPDGFVLEYPDYWRTEAVISTV
jgi:hypothetical protein